MAEDFATEALTKLLRLHPCCALYLSCAVAERWTDVMLEQSAHRMALQVVPWLWAYIARTMVLTYWTFLVLRHNCGVAENRKVRFV